MKNTKTENRQTVGKYETVARLIHKSGLAMTQSASANSVSDDCDVLLVNEMGKLNAVYAVADFAFVGGSIADRGGHNALEPAARKLPVMMGPNTYNNPVICAKLAESGALFIVEDAAAMTELTLSWCKNADAAALAGLAGYTVLEQNSGALDKTMKVVELYNN